MEAPAQQHFDKIAQAYEEVPKSWASVYNQARSRIEPLIQGKTVLDIGNGGYFPYETRLASEVIALDISPAMLERVRDPHVTKKVGDARNLDGIPDDSVDVILFLLSIHHINGGTAAESARVLDQVIASARLKLRRGGSLVLLEPTLHPSLFALERFLFGFTRRILERSRVSMVYFYSPDVLRERLAAGFNVAAAKVAVDALPIKGWVDLMGGTFPGVLKLPGFMSPTRIHFFRVDKQGD